MSDEQKKGDIGEVGEVGDLGDLGTNHPEGVAKQAAVPAAETPAKNALVTHVTGK
jgi:hypothetical protein